MIKRREFVRLHGELDNLSTMHDTALRLLHEAELRAAKAEALAEERQLEILRLENMLGSIPPRGGFVNRLEPETEDAQAEEPEDDHGLTDRMDEVFGAGLSLEEIERRQSEYRARETARLREELEEVRAEQRDIERLASVT